MAITAGEDILASDFVATSAVSGDNGKAAKLNSVGKFDGTFLPFGGDGSDGALNVTSGSTNIDLGAVQYFVKQYTSINVSSGATLTFSNAHANGTVIILKSRGNVGIIGTVTATGLGSTGVGAGNCNEVAQGDTGLAGANGDTAEVTTSNVTGYAILPVIYGAGIVLRVGSAGGDGGNGYAGGGTTINNGAGGDGGPAIVFECGGNWNFTGTINADGSDGASNTAGSPSSRGGGGGGGGGGCIVVLYSGTLTADSGTYNYGGGDGGDTGTASGSGSPTPYGGAGGVGGGNTGDGGGGGKGSASGATDGDGIAGGGTQGGALGDCTATGGGAGGGGGGGGEGFAYTIKNTFI